MGYPEKAAEKLQIPEVSIIMTTDQLQYFLAITEYDTFLEAADSLHV